MNRHIFTYGSLMFPPVWGSITVGEYKSLSATVEGIKRVKIVSKQSADTYPVAFKHPNAGILTGQLYLDVSPEDIARLDTFEGSYYERETITVTTSNGPLNADIYLLKKRHLYLATELSWSPEEFEKQDLNTFIDTYTPN